MVLKLGYCIGKNIIIQNDNEKNAFCGKFVGKLFSPTTRWLKAKQQ